MYIVEGVLLGMASIVFIGPVLFVLINATIYNGTKSGVAVALGIIVGDIIFSIACFKGINLISDNSVFNEYLGYIGFVILLFFGVANLFKKQKPIIKGVSTTKDIFVNFAKGFSINFFNPFVLAIWLALVNYARANHTEEQIPFIAAVIFGILLIDLIKIYLSKFLINLLTSKKIKYLYKATGIVMILFAFRILYSL